MQTVSVDVPTAAKRIGRRFGYGLAAIINLALVVVVQNLLEWGWPPFLTAEFETVIPWITTSLIVSAAVNLIFLVNDRRVPKATGNILTNVISLFVTYRVYQVFPFDFSAYEFDWGLIARILLVLAMVGAGIGVLAEAVKLVSGGLNPKRRYVDANRI